MNAIIDLTFFKLTYTKKEQTMHYVIDETTTDEIKKNSVDELINENSQTENLPFNTNVQAEIRTTTNEPVWIKQFPYPMSCTDFVNKEIKKNC